MRFSFSQLNMYLKCGEQYRRRYVLGQRLPPLSSAIRGQAQDAAQNLDLGRKIESDELAPEEEVIETAVDTVVKGFADEVRLTEEERSSGRKKIAGEITDLAIRSSKLHHRGVAPSINPTATQMELVYRVPSVEHEVVSWADVVEADGTLRDTKTGTKKPDAEAALLSDQLTMYSMGYRATTGKHSPRQVLDHLVMRKAAPKKQAPGDPVKLVHAEGPDGAYELEVTNTPDDHARVALRMQEAAAAIDAGYFPPSLSKADGGWWCSLEWCGYYQTCPYVRGGAVLTVPGINDAA